MRTDLVKPCILCTCCLLICPLSSVCSNSDHSELEGGGGRGEWGGRREEGGGRGSKSVVEYMCIHVYVYMCHQ